MKIGIIAGSTRQGRNSAGVAHWVAQGVAGREGVESVLLDLATFELPMFDAPMPPMMLNRKYESDAVKAWSQAVDDCDGFIFVLPEYNRSVPAVLKNAIDWLAPEWMDKTAACVGYGSANGIRAVEHCRSILTNFTRHVIRPQVALSIFTDISDGAVVPSERLQGDLKNMVDGLVAVIARRQA